MPGGEKESLPKANLLTVLTGLAIDNARKGQLRRDIDGAPGPGLMLRNVCTKLTLAISKTARGGFEEYAKLCGCERVHMYIYIYVYTHLDIRV